MTDHGLSAAAEVIATTAVGALALTAVALGLGRGRSDLDLRAPLLAAFGLRVAAAATIGLTSLNTSARGIDETSFLFFARILAHLPFSSRQWGDALTGYLTLHGFYNAGTLHIFVMAVQIRFFGGAELALRATMAALSVIGIALIATAVYELAGSKSSRLTAWVLTIEPANIFFSTALHKEPLLYLAVGLAALGAALVWKRRRIYASVLLMAAGSLVATATATYVGWFLAAACLAVLLHASARQLRDRVRAALGLALLGTCVALLAIPAVSQRTQRELSALQQSQNKNANLHSRLGLGRVDFSTPAEIAVNLPKRMIDLILRPYPWQLDDTNQRLAVIETLFVLVLLAVLTRTVFVRRAGLGLLPPLAYPALFMWIAYSLAVANAGTGFRYRAQVIPLLIGMAFVLRAGTQGPPSHHAEAGGDALRASATRLGAR